MKLLKLGAVLVLLLVVLGLGAAWLFLGPLVGAAIEKGSTYATGVETKVEAVDASFFSGHFGLDGLTLANPPGFRPDPFLHLGSVRASWQNGSILSDRIEMDELVLDGVEINLERTSKGTNYGVILDHLEGLSSGGGAKEEPAEGGGGRALAIRKIEVRNVRAGLHLSDVPVVSGSQTVEVPSIVIEDFRSDGSSTEVIAQLTSTLLQAILESVVANGGDILPKDVLKDLGAGLGGLTKGMDTEAKGVLQGVQGALKDVGGLFKKD